MECTMQLAHCRIREEYRQFSFDIYYIKNQRRSSYSVHSLFLEDSPSWGTVLVEATRGNVGDPPVGVQTWNVTEFLTSGDNGLVGGLSELDSKRSRLLDRATRMFSRERRGRVDVLPWRERGWESVLPPCRCGDMSPLLWRDWVSPLPRLVSLLLVRRQWSALPRRTRFTNWRKDSWISISSRPGNQPILHKELRMDARELV
jgi:hypothetical protein